MGQMIAGFLVGVPVGAGVLFFYFVLYAKYDTEDFVNQVQKMIARLK